MTTKKTTAAKSTAKAKGETIAVIAEDLNLSVATVRRMVTNLLLAEQIEAVVHADTYTPGEKKVIVSSVGEDSETDAA